MDSKFKFIETNEQIELSLNEFKNLKQESVEIRSLPEWLAFNAVCEDIRERRIITGNKFNMKKLNLPWCWNESNYGRYWVAFK